MIMTVSDSARESSSGHTQRPLATGVLAIVGAWLMSLLFWLGLGLTAVLLAALVLSPRWLQAARLQQRFAENAQIVSRLEQEARHLARVTAALKTDPEYLARVASAELQSLPAGGMKIHLNDALGYDSRIPTESNVSLQGSLVPRYFPLLEVLATSPAIRTRITCSAAVLMVLTFLCFNEHFFHGGLQRAWESCGVRLGGRYTITPRRDAP